ncbi:unnamed protein product, partial [Meganyctiphanes norvegica]
LIPIYFLVNGVFMLAMAILEVILIMTDLHENKCVKFSRIVYIFLPIWFIVGCVMVYRNYEPNYEIPPVGEDQSNYCKKSVYMFAFWSLNIHFILFGLFFCGCCCAC